MGQARKGGAGQEEQWQGQGQGQEEVVVSARGAQLLDRRLAARPVGRDGRRLGVCGHARAAARRCHTAQATHWCTRPWAWTARTGSCARWTCGLTDDHNPRWTGDHMQLDERPSRMTTRITSRPPSCNSCVSSFGCIGLPLAYFAVFFRSADCPSERRSRISPTQNNHANCQKHKTFGVV